MTPDWPPPSCRPLRPRPRDASYHCGVVRKLQDGVVYVGGDTVMSGQGVEDGAEHAALWRANVCDDAG